MDKKIKDFLWETECELEVGGGCYDQIKLIFPDSTCVNLGRNCDVDYDPEFLLDSLKKTYHAWEEGALNVD